MNMVNELDLRIALLGLLIEGERPILHPIRAHAEERGLELRETLHRGVGARILVLREHGLAIEVLHRLEALLEVAAPYRIVASLLRFEREAIAILARKTFDGRDEIG